MARKTDPKMADEVVRLVEQHPNGATIEDLESGASTSSAAITSEINTATPA